jgi:methionyl-tRNA formyltransferase
VRCIFFGTPAIAIPSLEALLGISDLVAAVCQPDRPGGRGLKQTSPPVKLWAQSKEIQVLQPDNLKDGELASWISAQSIDVCVVLAYGKILPQAVLDSPRLGCLNLHASLLPRHRGAAPIQWSIISGDEKTGVTLMRMDAGLDTGPILSQHELAISPREDAGTLTERIGDLCAIVVREDVPKYVKGELAQSPQDNPLATWAPPIKAADRRVTFDDAAVAIDARIRALSPAPGALTQCRGRILRLLETRPLARDSVGAAGTVTLTPERHILVSTRAGSLQVLRAQLEGKKPQEARDLINGRTIVQDDLLGG